jgi:F-box/leucine-rich repeat protein 10/11
MAPSKRRAARTNQQAQQNNKNSPHHSGSRLNSPDNAAATEPGPQPGDDDGCPGCTPTSKELMKGSKKESWIECDNCNTWYHWRCVGNGEVVENISKWCAQPLQLSLIILHGFGIQVL